MKLTKRQILWLKSRGGRTLEDVVEADGKYYTPMTTMDGMGFLQIPRDEEIKKHYHIKFRSRGKQFLQSIVNSRYL
jgi:hypothetical protein